MPRERKDIELLEKFSVKSTPHKVYRLGREPLRENETPISVQRP